MSHFVTVFKINGIKVLLISRCDILIEIVTPIGSSYKE
jgi:hypothetical protein